MIRSDKIDPRAVDHALDGPLPGQSLTNSPDQKYPWESPPEMTAPQDAIQKIFLEILKDENLELFADLMAKKVPIADLATMIGMASFTKGKMNPDLMLTVLEPTMYMLLTIAEKLGINPVLYRGEQEDDRNEMVSDKSEAEEILKVNSKAKQNVRLKDLKVQNVNKASVSPEINQQLDQLDLSKVRESLLQKPQDKPQPESLLGR